MTKRSVRLFWPILKHFETDAEPANYRQSHRVILNIVGSLFLFLSLASALAAFNSGQLAAFIPVAVFFAVGLVAVVVGSLGSDAAVSRIWRRR